MVYDKLKEAKYDIWAMRRALLGKDDTTMEGAPPQQVDNKMMTSSYRCPSHDSTEADDSSTARRRRRRPQTGGSVVQPSPAPATKKGMDPGHGRRSVTKDNAFPLLDNTTQLYD